MSYDVLQPQIIAIGNRRYRRNMVNSTNTGGNNQPERPYEEETDDMFIENRQRALEKTTRNNKKHPQPADEYNDEISCKAEIVSRSHYDDDDDDEDYADIFLENNTYKLKMAVSDAYFGFIIGRNAEKKNGLERDTQTTIRIPKKSQDQNATNSSDFITIEGKSKASVASCRNRLILVIGAARNQRSFTHMLTFPVNFEHLKSRYAVFCDLVTKNCSRDRGVDPSIFIVPNKIHLTICVLTLLSQSEIEQARGLLDQCRQTFIRELTAERELSIRVQGLEYMNDDPSAVDVLYARVNPTNGGNGDAVQQIADKLMQRFVEAGLGKKQYERVKLHATIMNTLRRAEDGEKKSESPPPGEGQAVKERESFDARNILKLYGDFDFGEFALKQVHLSLRFSTGADGYYECVSKIKF